MSVIRIYEPRERAEGFGILGALNAFAGMLLLGGAWFAVDFAIWAWTQ